MLSTKFQEALGKGGFKTVVIGLLCYLVLFVINLVVIGGSVAAMFSNGLAGFPSNLGGSILAIVIMGLVSMLLALFIGAGQLGSFKDAVEGANVSFNSYWTNCKRYFLGMLGYGILYIIVTGALALLLVGLPAAVSGSALGGFWSVLGDILLSVLIFVYVTPQFFLRVVDYQPKDFVRNNFLPLIACALVYGILVFVPLIGAIASFILELFYPLFVFVLYSLQKSADTTQNNSGTPV